MEITPQDRAKFVIKWLTKDTKKPQSYFANLLGYSNPTVLSQMLNGQKEYPKSLPSRIAALDSRINLDFLLGTSDDMLIGDNGRQSEPPKEAKTHTATVRTATPIYSPQKGSIIVPPELAKMFEDLTYTVRSQQDMIRNLIDSAKPGVSITNVANNNTNK